MRRRHRQNNTETTVLPADHPGEHQSFFSGGVGGPSGAGGAGSVGGVPTGGAAGYAGTAGTAGPAGASLAGGDGFGATGSTSSPYGVSEAPAEPEAIVVRVRRHGRRLTLPVIALVAIAGAAGYFIGWFPEAWMNIAAAIGALGLMLLLGIVPILAWLSHRTVVTTRRVISHRGFLVRHRSEVSLARVREVKSRQNLVQRMFGSGDVQLFVGAESTTIADAPDARHLHASLQELSERSYDEQVRAAARFGL